MKMQVCAGDPGAVVPIGAVAGKPMDMSVGRFWWEGVKAGHWAFLALGGLGVWLLLSLVAARGDKR